MKFLSVTVLLTLVPVAGAQLGHPVDECASQCYPLDHDANGATPHTGAQVSTSILYGHFQNTLNRAPMNLQLPDSQEPDLNEGFLAPTLNTETGTDADIHFANNRFQMFSSPGFVEILNDAWRVHQEPGMAAEVRLAGDAMNLYVYVSAYPIPGQSSSSFTSTMVDVMPQVAVNARLETGRFVNQGLVIAEGDTGSDDLFGLIGGSGRVNVLKLPGQPEIYEFRVPLVIKNHVISADAAGVLLSFEVYQLKVKDGPLAGTQVGQNDWRLRVGPKTPVHVAFQTVNPLRTVAKAITPTASGLEADWSVISPWGSYDVDDRSLSALAVGPDNIRKPATLTLVNRSVDHDGHFKPTLARFALDPMGLPDGDYTLRLSALNHQGTYRLTDKIAFHLAGGVVGL